MHSNGKKDHAPLRPMILMMMYLVDESKEHGLYETAQVLQGQIEKIMKDYNISEDDLIPEVDSDGDDD